jgi:hypothetical protein
MLAIGYFVGVVCTQVCKLETSGLGTELTLKLGAWVLFLDVVHCFTDDWLVIASSVHRSYRVTAVTPNYSGPFFVVPGLQLACYRHPSKAGSTLAF